MAAVARAAGVATSIGSKALREDPTIPPERRQEIRKIADALGYRPNPMPLVVAQIHRNGRGSPQIPHTLLLLDGIWSE